MASLGDQEELARRRASTPRRGRTWSSSAPGSSLTLAPRPVANFVYAEVGEDARPVFDDAPARGRDRAPARPFGAPGAIRVTVGTKEENEVFAQAFGRVLALTG